MDVPDETRPALRGPLPGQNLPPLQALHGPSPDEARPPPQALLGPFPDGMSPPPPQALHGPLPDEVTPPPPQALHGPLPDENDPAWSRVATEEHVAHRHSADDSFVSLFNWIARRFNRKAHRSDSAGAASHATGFAHYRRRFSRLNLRERRDLEKGKSAPLGTVSVQSPTTEPADTTDTPPSHTSPILKPGPDYAKMGDTSSGSSNDAPLVNVTKVKDFIRQVHDLPWVSTDRVTIDYYPGQSKKRPHIQARPLQTKGPRHVRSWYSERTSGLLPFTVVPDSHDVSPPVPLTTTSHATMGHEVRLEGDNADALHRQGYVPPDAQQELAAQHADLTVHTSS